MAQSTDSTARCYCGAIALEWASAPRRAIHCHCGQCRRLSGAAFTTWASVRQSGFRVSVGEDSIAAFRVTANVLRHFCRHCGTHVFTLDSRLPKVVGVPVGILNGDTAGLTLDAHYFVDHKAAWFSIGDDVAQFGGESGIEPIGD